MSDTVIDPEGMVHKKVVVIALLSFALGMAAASFIAFAQYELGSGALEIGFGLLATTVVAIGGAELFDRRAPEKIEWSSE